MAHKFKLHQIVRLSAQALVTRGSDDGRYEVVRLLPADQAGIFSYRLRSSGGERVAPAHDLTPRAP